MRRRGGDLERGATWYLSGARDRFRLTVRRRLSDKISTTG